MSAFPALSHVVESTDVEALLRSMSYMQSPKCKVLALILSLTLGLLTLAPAQSPAGPDWETLRPEKEQFSVLIPKGSTVEEASKVPYHKMALNTRFYISKTAGGPVFAVVSLSGIPPNPAAYTEMQRVNSYVDAFKTLFVPKIRDKAGLAQLTFVRERSLQGNPGREYRLTVGNLSGIAHVYATSRRFYALVYLNNKKDEALQDQFLSSFVIPERSTPTSMPSTVVAEQNEPTPKRPRVSPAIAEENAEPLKHGIEDTLKADDASATGESKPKRAPISGGVLNGKAITLPKPDYPADAQAAGASGTVVIQVTIDESGMVISTRAISGHPLLRQAAINAAMQARFSPTSLMGEPVKVTGVITYNFVKQ
jgi:TonB family protein